MVLFISPTCLLSLSDADLYANITEEDIVDRIKEFLLPDAEFNRIREDLKVLIS